MSYLPPGQQSYVDIPDTHPLAIWARRAGRTVSLCLAIRAGMPSTQGGTHVPTVDECDVCTEPVWRSNRAVPREAFLLVCTFCTKRLIIDPMRD